MDDWTKIARRRSLGLAGRWKLVWLAGITVIVGLVVPIVAFRLPCTCRSSTSTCRSRAPGTCSLFFIIAGAANGVNLTDGIDGLAAGTTTIALLTYTAMSLVAALSAVRRGAPADPVDLDLAILGASLIGASIGFLWYNAFPAQVFMGDTGSMGLGGALAAFAIMTKTELLLLLIGGIFVVEALSVIIQVLSFKWLGPAGLPDGAAAPPLRDEGLVGDPDHGALLDRHRDSLRLRLRPLLRVFLQLQQPGLVGRSSSASPARVRRPRSRWRGEM